MASPSSRFVFVQLPGLLWASLIAAIQPGSPPMASPRRDEVEGGRAHGVGVVIAEDASAAGQDVFVQLPGRLVLAQPGQRGDEVEGGPQGVGVVLAQDAAGQGVFVQLPGRLVLADRTQADSARYSRSPSPGDAPPPHPF